MRKNNLKNNKKFLKKLLIINSSINSKNFSNFYPYKSFIILNILNKRSNLIILPDEAETTKSNGIQLIVSIIKKDLI